MKKTFAVIGATLALAMGALAQETPRYEVFLGYQLVRFGSTSGFVPLFNSIENFDNFTANGGAGQFAYNFNHRWSAVLDIGAVHSNDIDSLALDATWTNFLLGPRYSFIRHDRWRLFGQVLLGGVVTTASRQLTVLPVFTDANGNLVVTNTPVVTRVNQSNGRFALTAGGGVEFKVNKHIALRPINAEYFLMNMATPISNDNGDRLNAFRFTAGVNFLFGSR